MTVGYGCTKWLSGVGDHQKFELNLEDGEEVSGFYARTGSWTDRLAFETTKGRTIHAGGMGGNLKEVKSEGKRFIGLRACVNNQIDGLQFYFVDELED